MVTDTPKSLLGKSYVQGEWTIVTLQWDCLSFWVSTLLFNWQRCIITCIIQFCQMFFLSVNILYNVY